MASPRPRWIRALDATSVVLCGALCIRLALALEAPHLAWWPLLALAALAGVAVADLASGLVHFACDRFGAEETPFLGAVLIRPFREHHRDPHAIVRHGFLEANGNNALAVSPLVFALGALAPHAAGSLGAALVLAAGGAFATAVAATNAIHRAAHAGASRGPLAWLRRAGFALAPAAHAVHHRGPHDRSYCITTGWWNPLLDQLGFWERCERAIRSVAPGAAPQP